MVVNAFLNIVIDVLDWRGRMLPWRNSNICPGFAFPPEARAIEWKRTGNLSKQPAKNYDPGHVAVGNTVDILRPHLWSGCRAIVENKLDDGQWWLAVAGRDGAVFHTQAPASVLSVVLWKGD